MKSLENGSGTLDGVDQQLLTLLFDNARMRTAELARRVGLSAPSTTERLKRLEEAGVISGYTINVNPAMIGLPLPVCLRIRPVPGSLKKVVDIIREIPEIVECDRVTGEDCFIARAHVRSVQHMEAVIDRLHPFSTTTTSIIQTAPVSRRLPVLDC